MPARGWVTAYDHPTQGPIPYGTTTMEDCCQGTALRTQNVADAGSGDLDADYNVMYSCTADGEPLTYGDADDDVAEAGVARHHR